MTFKQLSFEDWLADKRWCKKHRRHNCACGHKAIPGYIESIDTKIIEVMRLHAAGRVAVSSEWISIQLLIEYGIDRTERTIRNHLHNMQRQGKVIFRGYRKGWQIFDSFHNLPPPALT